MIVYRRRLKRLKRLDGRARERRRVWEELVREVRRP